MFTDGVTEAENSHGEFFGDEGLESLIERCCHESAQTLLQSLRDAVDQHTGPVGTSDDMTVRLWDPEAGRPRRSGGKANGKP